MNRIIKNKQGVSLAEMLIALLLLSLLTLCLTAGINSAVRVYRELMFDSESQILISGVNEQIEDILRNAEDIKSVQDGWTFSNMQRYTLGENEQRYKYGIKDGTIRVADGYIVWTSAVDSEPRVVGGKGLYSNGRLYVEQTQDLSYDSDQHVFKMEYVVKDKYNTDQQSQTVTVCVRNINS